MKWILIFLLLPIAVYSQNSRRIDVKNFQAQNVNLDFKPAYDLIRLRHDVYRQTQTKTVNDSVSETENVPYNEIGFEIGDFLFVDYNHNITVQIDKLLGLNLESPFLVSRSYHPFRINRIDYFQYEKGVLSYKRNNNGRKREQFHLSYSENDIDVFYKKRLQYSIIETDEKLSKQGKRRWNETIFWNGDENYSNSKRRIWSDKYFKKDNVIHIDKEFLIKTNAKQNAIEIYYYSRKHANQPVYTIQYNDHSIIVYDKNRRGYYIQYSPKKVDIYNRGKKIIRYERMR